jgi:hypothetical protein
MADGASIAAIVPMEATFRLYLTNLLQSSW